MKWRSLVRILLPPLVWTYQKKKKKYNIPSNLGTLNIRDGNFLPGLRIQYDISGLRLRDLTGLIQ